MCASSKCMYVTYVTKKLGNISCAYLLSKIDGRSCAYLLSKIDGRSSEETAHASIAALLGSREPRMSSHQRSIRKPGAKNEFATTIDKKLKSGAAYLKLEGIEMINMSRNPLHTFETFQSSLVVWRDIIRITLSEVRSL
jgi:hypothetical protein